MRIAASQEMEMPLSANEAWSIHSLYLLGAGRQGCFADHLPFFFSCIY